MGHWINDYIGLAWERGAKGPDRFDCLGLVQHVQSSRYGVPMPDISCGGGLLSIMRAMRDPANWSGFAQVDAPGDGDLVRLFRNQYPDHIGIWVDVDGGGVLHSSQKNGVQFDTPFLLRSMGWERIEFFRRLPGTVVM